MPLKVFQFEMTETDAIALSDDPQVESVTEDANASVTGTQLTPPSWGLDCIDQRNLQLNNIYTYKPTARGAHAYVLDTGIRPTHQDFNGRASIAADFVGDGQNGHDCHGHGTHVAGTIGSNTYGVAKGVTIHAVRVANCLGSAPFSVLIAGVNWITFNRINPAVANVSLAGPAFLPLDQAVTNSINSGVTYVIGAGNDGGDAINTSPARVFPAITVGATDIFDNRAVFTALSSSNYGSVLDLFAPGKLILSTWYDSDTSTATIGGTSMAAPHVSGVVAQYLQLNPGHSPATVRNAIVGNATPGVVINAGPGSPNLLLYSDFQPEPPEHTTTDFDGDLKSDIALWRPSTGTWQITLSSNNTTNYMQWGGQIHNDIIVPGDYEGDGKADRAVWRPATGIWYIVTE